MRRLRADVGPDLNGGGWRNVARTSYSGEMPNIVETGIVAASTPWGWAGMSVQTKQTASYNADGLPKENTVEMWNTSTSSFNMISRVNHGYDFDRRAQCTAVRMNENFPTSPSSACSPGSQGSFGPDRISYQGYNGWSEPNVSLSAYGISGVQRTDRTNYFDPATGVLSWVEDPRGFRTEYQYDGFNRLEKTKFPDPATPHQANNSDYEQLFYFNNGRLQSLQRRDLSTITYAYDNLGRVRTQTPSGNGPTLNIDYDNFGNVISQTDGVHTLTYAYDALSRLTSETQDGLAVSYEYDPAGRRTRLTWPDNFHITYEYEVLAGVTKIRENGGTVLAGLSYDVQGRRLAANRGGAAATGYVFDNASRLTGIGLSGSSNDTWTTLSYTPVGQIASRSVTNPSYEHPSSTFTDTYGAANGLNQYPSLNSTAFSYDGRGNLTHDGNRSYGYDIWNRMTSAGPASLVYDPSSRLRDVTSGGTTTRFVYDGVDLIAEYNGSSLIRRYVHGPGVDEPLIWYENGNRSNLYADERGSIVRVEGAFNSTNTYDAYGRRGSGNVGRFQYTGQIWLSEAGLYYYKARMYNPEIGRFMQTDPIGFAGGMNLYGYVEQDPINLTDPSGLDSCDPSSVDSKGYETVTICPPGNGLPDWGSIYIGPSDYGNGGGGGDGATLTKWTPLDDANKCHAEAVAADAAYWNSLGYLTVPNVSLFDFNTGKFARADLVAFKIGFVGLFSEHAIIEIKTGGGIYSPNQEIVYSGIGETHLIGAFGRQAVLAGLAESGTTLNMVKSALSIGLKSKLYTATPAFSGRRYGGGNTGKPCSTYMGPIARPGG